MKIILWSFCISYYTLYIMINQGKCSFFSITRLNLINTPESGHSSFTMCVFLIVFTRTTTVHFSLFSLIPSFSIRCSSPFWTHTCLTAPDWPLPTSPLGFSLNKTSWFPYWDFTLCHMLLDYPGLFQAALITNLVLWLEQKSIQ